MGYEYSLWLSCFFPKTLSSLVAKGNLNECQPYISGVLETVMSNEDNFGFIPGVILAA